MAGSSRVGGAIHRTDRKEVRFMEIQTTVLEAVIADMLDSAEDGNFNSAL